MNIASLSMCYPSETTPGAGLFIRRRLLALSAANHVRVINPQPAPVWSARRRNIIHHPGPPPVWHVPMPYVPGLSLPLNPRLYASAVAPVIASWRQSAAVDIIDAHFCWPDGVAAAALSRRLGIPYAITLRGVLQRFTGNRLTRSAVIRALNGAATVIAVSDHLKRSAVALGVPEHRITVVRNGIDAETFHPADRNDARRTLGRSADETILLTVGHLCRRKGAHRVLRILPELIAKHANLRYVIVGGDAAEGRFEKHLRSLTRRLDIGRHVTFTGNLPSQQVATWLQAADLFVLPTTNEGCCNALCEAVAAGLPVVTTDVGGNRELVPRASGLLVPPRDDDALAAAISATLESRPHRPAVARAAQKRTWDRVASETAAALQNAVRHTPGPTPVPRQPVRSLAT